MEYTLRWVLLAVLLTPVAGFAATLVETGQARSVVIVAAEPQKWEQQAAKELVEYIEKMSGVKLPLLSIAADGLEPVLADVRVNGHIPIILGGAARPRLNGDLDNEPRGAFVLYAEQDLVIIAGHEEGTYYGVIELLEQLGCRWFMPGDLGTIVPELKTVQVREQRTIQRPSFTSRWFQMPDRDWQMRVRCGGDIFRGRHGIKAPPYVRDKDTGEFGPAEHAEYYGLVNGKRVPRQHCISNPKLLAYVIADVKSHRQAGRGPDIGLGPNDGTGFCECESCRALDAGDWDPFSNEPSVTDRYIWFYNQVLKGVEDEYPDTKLSYYLYHSYMRPPVREKPDPRIVGALAPIALDRVHGFSNPVAPEKSYLRWLYQEWGKIMPELYDRGYWSNLACPGFPFIIVHRLRDEIPACHELGVKGWRVETFPNYGPQFPSMYIAGKLMWNHQADVDALLADCYDKFFGPAAAPMGRYITLMDAALRDGDHATGSAWDMPHFYPPTLRKQARALLDQAADLTKDKGVYAQRVTMITQTFDMLEAFNAMMAARVQVDFIAAKAELDKLDAIANELMAYKPVPMLSAGKHSTYVGYMRRFFRFCTEQGHERVTGGNKLIAAAGDQWQFQIDPAKVGQDIGLWRDDITGGSWQTIRTSSSSWSNQGLRYYKGLAWYRQTVEVPADAVGQRIFLWCGGVDESAMVWLNGQVLGISHAASMYPFELDATHAVRPGNNVIVFCVANEVVNEIGTGGILAPVILYAPKDGKDATLRNIRDPKPTFP